MKRVKKEKKNSGRSKSQQELYGIRRRVSGLELAPRSLRSEKRRFLNECDEENLKKIGLGMESK